MVDLLLSKGAHINAQDKKEVRRGVLLVSSRPIDLTTHNSVFSSSSSFRAFSSFLEDDVRLPPGNSDFPGHANVLTVRVGCCVHHSSEYHIDSVEYPLRWSKG